MAAISALQLLSITTALTSAGGIATLSMFDIPELQSQPASRSLPMTRWLFSRGSHIFPTAAFASSAGFLGLALTALHDSKHPLRPTSSLSLILSSISHIWRLTQNGAQVNGYLAAAALCIAIGPFTALVMVPAVNFPLIEANEKKGAARSAKSAELGDTSGGAKTAEESVDGKGQANQFTDLSGPQEKTKQDSSRDEDEKVRGMLGKFALLNNVRAVLMMTGGMVGLWTAISYRI